jgi:glutathione synthase/RimK-type ligase-like ATP-grasp enzyme
MAKKLVVIPHNMGSRSAKALADTLSGKLGFKVWRTTPAKVRNRIPFVLREGTDKLTQLTKFKENNVATVEFTADRAVAADWVRDGCVFCRTLLRSSEGKGIVVAEKDEELVPAPLYTRYFKKKAEYRVHVLFGNVIDVQAKRKRKGVEERNTKIRNLANGYVFCRDGIVEPDGLRELAIRATATLGYSLGAVDIAYNEHHKQLVVLEVNANPGLQGTTLETYSNAIVNWYKEQQRAV